MAIVIGISLALVTATLGAGPSTGSQSCTLGTLEAKSQLWTPVIILNSPYGGAASANATIFASPQGTIVAGTNVSNGAVGAVFYLDTWGLYSLTNLTSSSGSAGGPCTLPYAAVDLSWNAYGETSTVVHTLYLAESGTQSDLNLPRQASMMAPNGTLYESVLFNDTYAPGLNPSNDTNLSTCGSSMPNELQTRSGRLPFLVPFYSEYGESITLPASLPLPSTYQYSFPMEFGTWSITDAIHEPGFNGAGHAYSYSHC